MNKCRGCDADIAPGRTWCPPSTGRTCLADYRREENYRAKTLRRDGYDCAACPTLFNRAILANRATGRLRLFAAIAQLVVFLARGKHKRVLRHGWKHWRTRVVDADHIDPIGATGTHDLRNLQVLCNGLPFRHHERKTVRDIAGMKGVRPPLDKMRAARWVLLTAAAFAVGSQLLTDDLRSAWAVDPTNGARLTVVAVTAPTVWVPAAVLAVAVLVGAVAHRWREALVTRVAAAVAEETDASKTMRRPVRVRRWGRVPGHWLPMPVVVEVRYPPTFRDSDPAAVDRVEQRVRARLGWTSSRLELFTSKHPPRMRLQFPDPFITQQPTPTPLLQQVSTDLFDPISIGFDSRGKERFITLVERNLLVAGEPGGGKSNALSIAVAAACMDRNVTVFLLDGKSVEFPIWERCAERVVKGQNDEAFKAAIEMLRELQQIIDMRQDLMAAEQTENTLIRKVTRGDSFGLYLLAIDELATFTAPGSRPKAQIEMFVGLLRDILQRGRALGVICLLATQRPAAEVVPTSIRDIIGVRWALRCTTPTSSDMVLGQGYASMGFSAARVHQDARGAGYVLSEGSAEPVLVRAHYVPDEDLVALARQARAVRGIPPLADAPGAVGTSVD